MLSHYEDFLARLTENMGEDVQTAFKLDLFSVSLIIFSYLYSSSKLYAAVKTINGSISFYLFKFDDDIFTGFPVFICPD